MTVVAGLTLGRLSPSGPESFFIGDYFHGTGREHLWGVIGGVIWAVGTTSSFIASDVQTVGPVVSYALGGGAALVAVLWGLIVWKEFRNAPRVAYTLLNLMFVFFLAGLITVGLAPVIK